MADSTLSNLTSLTLPSQATDLLLVGRGTARPNKVAMSDALNSAALAATTGAYGVVQLAASGGTTAGTVVQATDARLSDTRNPPDGSKGDIVVSGSGSTWTIKTDPIFKGIATVATTGGVATHVLEYTGGNSLFTGYNATNSVFAQNGGASMTLSNSVAIAAAGSNQSIQLTPTGSGRVRIAQSAPSAVTNNFGLTINDVADTRNLSLGVGPNYSFIQSYNSVPLAINPAGNVVLFGKETNSANGFIQLADHTAATGGIGMGTDWSFFRLNTSVLRFQTASASPGLSLRHSTSGTELTLTASTASGNGIVNTVSCNNLVLGVNGGTALTLDVVQNATFAKDIFLGTSGPSVPSTLSGRAARQILAFNGTAGTTVVQPAFGTGNFSLAFTLRLNSLPASAAVIFGNSLGGAIPQTYVLPTGVLKIDGSGAINSASTLVINKTYSIAIVRSGTTTSIYIDGVLDTSATDTKNYSSGIDLIGRNSAGNYLDGSLYPMAYNRALSAAEVKALYERGVPDASDINNASNTALANGTWTNVNYTTVTGASSSGFTATMVSGIGYITSTLPFTPQKGTRLRVKGTLTLNNGTTPIPSAYVDGTAATLVPLTVGAFDVVVTVPTAPTVAGLAMTTNGNADYTISGLVVTRVGAVLAPDAAQTGGGLTWYDTSGNGANITLPASGVAWNVPFNGRMQFGDGTYQAPSMTFANDPDTGFYKVSAATDIVYFGAGGQPSLRFVGGGTLYSGLSNAYLQFPSGGAVSLNADAATNSNITLVPGGTGLVSLVTNGVSQFSNANNQVGYTVTNTNAGTGAFASYQTWNGTTGLNLITWGSAYTGRTNENWIYSVGAYPLRFGTDSTIRMMLTGSSGNLLIGTATDSSNGKLQLATHTAATGGIGFGTDTALYRANAGQLYLDAPASTSGAFWVNAGAGNTSASLNLYPQGTGVAQVSAVGANSLLLRTNNTTALTIDSSQNATFTQNVTALGNIITSQIGDPRITAQKTSLALNTQSQLILAQGSTLFGANDRTYQLLSNGESGTAAYFGIQYWNGSAYALRFKIDSSGNATINGNLTVTGTISPSSGAGLTNVWIPASQWIPRTTNGCGVDSTETTTNRQNFDELLFDPAAIEYAQALVRMPSNYNNGTVTARFFWSSSSSTGSVVWGLQARAFADDDALDTAFGTAQTVTDTLLATGDMHISAATSAVTSGGTPAATTPLQFQIYRDATNGSDTLGSDARLLGVEISYTSV